ncbi:hypothetical protein LM599_01390 [Candidatus Acetothermia bacterium]|nr:hypothetical protein [Candidatus Acetothermia bacterium]
MKFNKNKSWLAVIVVIVAVLALSLLLSGYIDASGDRALGFLEVGRYYTVGYKGLLETQDIKVLEIRGDGWIRKGATY